MKGRERKQNGAQKEDSDSDKAWNNPTGNSATTGAQQHWAEMTGLYTYTPVTGHKLPQKDRVADSFLMDISVVHFHVWCFPR